MNLIGKRIKYNIQAGSATAEPACIITKFLMKSLFDAVA